MNRKSVIKQILAEATGNPILTDEYSYSDVREELAPVIKVMRKTIDEARRSVATLKSQVLRNKGQENWSSLAREIRVKARELFQLRNKVKQVMDSTYDETPFKVKQWAVGTFGKLATDIGSRMEKAGDVMLSAEKTKASGATDTLVSILEEVDDLFYEMNESIYNITDRQLY